MCARRDSPESGVISPACIELWCSFVRDVEDRQLWRRYRALLSAEEHSRMERFHFEQDRRRDLLTRALVRTVLSRYAPIAPEQWRFSPDANGRPRIAGPRPLPAVEFNISHTRELVVVGVSSGGAIGVDAEDLERRSNAHLAERYFAPSERAGLRSLDEQARRRRFLELWTLKESYLKARGVGLRLPLEAFAFDFLGEDGLRLSITPTLEDSPGRWSFGQFVLRGRFVLAVGAENGAHGPRRLIVREGVPLAWDRLAQVELWRSAGLSLAQS